MKYVKAAQRRLFVFNDYKLLYNDMDSIWTERREFVQTELGACRHV